MSSGNYPVKEIQFANAQFLPEVVKLLEEGHTVTLRLKGYSMRPFLENNRDKALLIHPTVLNVGDAVLAEIAPRHYVLHRIIKIMGDDIILKGDGNLAVEHCQRKDIKGFVLGFYRKNRDKLDKTNGLKWRIYSLLWMRLSPIRRYLLAGYRRIWIKMFGPI